TRKTSIVFASSGLISANIASGEKRPYKPELATLRYSNSDASLASRENIALPTTYSEPAPVARPGMETADMTSLDSFRCCKTLQVGSKSYAYFSLPVAERNGLKGISRLPFSMKVLLENLLRNE